jgi:beta-galactosidase
MHRFLRPLVFVVLFAMPGFVHAGQPASGRMQPFDSDWLFIRQNAVDAQAPAYDDSGWRKLDLPHDWTIEDLPKPENAGDSGRVVSGPFDSESVGGINTGYTVGGTGWYRKHFTMPTEAAGKTVTVVFDGVFMDADVWINGQHLGNHPCGYTPFYFDITRYLNYDGRDNVLAVRVVNGGASTRWYSGSGIYRHVRLDVADNVHVAVWGIYVTTPEVGDSSAVARVDITLANDTGKRCDAVLETRILDPQGRVIATRRTGTRLCADVTSDIGQSFDVASPALWSPQSPSLYKAVCEVSRDGRVVDRSETTFGIRSIRFDPNKGFFLNGHSVKLMGGSVHADNGPLGAMAFDRAEARKVELLKAAGFNVTRTAHNPPSSAFLDACDRLGILVIDEAFDSWNLQHVEDVKDYSVYFKQWWKSDLGAVMLRDRSHPSVIMWGIGNQIREAGNDSGVRTAQELAQFVRSYDVTRPVMSNVFNWNGYSWEDYDPFFAVLGVSGYSYARQHYDEDHKRVPDRVIFSSEIDPEECFDNWMAVLDRDFVCGNIEWTAMDYIGESGLGWFGPWRDFKKTFPWHVSYCGDIDICGLRRPRSFYKEAISKASPAVSAFVHRPVPAFPGKAPSRWGWTDVADSWTWSGYEGKALQVDVYSNCEEVRLLVNGRDLGGKPTNRGTQFMAVWQVPYERGTLEAVGYNGGKEVARWELKSAGEPAAVRMSADRNDLLADGQDLSYVTVEIVDAEGVRVPNADKQVRFELEGAGSLAAVVNSKPDSLESFQQPERMTFEGRCMAIVRTTRAPGSITLKAHVDGLPECKVLLRTQAEDAR